MTDKPKPSHQITIKSNASLNIGGDVVGGDKKTIYNQVNNQVEIYQVLEKWEAQISYKVDSLSLPKDEKDDIKNQLSAIKEAISQDKNPSRIEKLINMLAIMSSDIFEVAITTLANPLAGIGLTLRKIGDKAKIESQAK